MIIKKPFKLAIVVLALLLGGFSGVHAEEFNGGVPVSPQPNEAALKQGLDVKYFFRYFDHINEVKALRKGKQGAPLKQLNHVSFEDGKVLTTNRPMGVGAHIRGLIKLNKAGKYVFRLQSNDGVKLYIGEVLLHTDPAIHAARWSPDLVYQVDTPGWYDFTLYYYQRKGTAALRFKWTPPGGEEEIVPPEAWAHLQ